MQPLLLYVALLQTTQLPLQCSDPHHPEIQKAALELHTHIRARARNTMLESVETLNCGNYSPRPGRVVALFQAQAGAGGERTNERKKNMQDKLGGEGYHAGATAVSLLPRLHAETAANARPGGLRESHKEAH